MQNIAILSIRQTFQGIAFIAIVITLSISANAQFRYSTNKVVIKDTIIASNILHENRKIDIYQPEVFPEYKDVVPPVIYVFDGEAYINYFANTINMLCQRFVQMPPIIIVGIENYVNGNYSARDRDFDSATDRFMQFVIDEVIPFVEKGYMKTPYRTIVGHSSSATFAMDVFFKKPSLFNAYIVSSPYLIGAKKLKIADSSLTYLNERNNTLFLSAGMEAWAQESVNRLDSLFKTKVQKGLSYRIMKYPNESHFSVFLKSYYDGFHYIFRIDPAEKLKSPMNLTTQMLHEHYQKMQDIFGVPLKPPQTLTGEYGHNYKTKWNNLEKALEFFKENAENYPSDPFSQIEYADALLKKGDKQNAIMRYEKALKLNPGDVDLKIKIVKLKNEKQK